ncbi:hypothetical protein G6F70_007649 [Rhizopus microsporus]|uniref:Small nuclear RNA activating complex, polypeptide 3 n=2 Tax=Rhizopus TaxID=4842 RepID=A0A367JJ38_RHIAZ|nr:hypothetical protein G6F71_007905 [Rhizopus microsporus]RCH89895.1 small nuclear RNA activating complex, polypeptide 3 [Rhizopus azygosporus]KAG1196191.1 hypothetical protein G6F70_007649 [Rhizopus microsporus]KAG1214152.1 hypothetical protein G6F69_002185 [Rhizopus microsporus]KAG1228540.1 hypothetical protein G6F67_007746 [Rhizopus microsporus]
MTTPSNLLNEFNDLFKQQAEIENSEEFKAKKQKYSDLKLEPKSNLSVRSEPFQDPDLLPYISLDNYLIVKKLHARTVRIRPNFNALTLKRPQAKDVSSTRIMDDEDVAIVELFEGAVQSDNVYINPIAPKRRKFMREESMSSANGISVSYTSTPAACTSVPDTPINVSSQPLSPSTTSEVSSSQGTSELEEAFNDISNKIKQSTLRSVGAADAYTLLARYHDYYSFTSMPEFPSTTTTQDVSSTDIKETVITVLFYVPDSYTKKLQEIDILGSHNLCDLRDTISCFSDLPTDIDDNDDSAESDAHLFDKDNKKLVPSFFYMDHTFYIDIRYEQNTEEVYEKMINEWLDKKKVDKSKLKYNTLCMEDTCLKDIALQLNRPLAYVHNSNCEHVFMIKDIKLLTPSEYDSTEDFPKTTRTLMYKRAKCSMCTIYPASYITKGDIISGHSPCYFCKPCFKSFHAGSDYDKQYNFKASRYYGCF